MKLTNILLAGFALAMVTTGCKKDEVNPSEPSGNAKLNVSLKASGIATKATDPEEQAGESNINNVAVLVFNEAGTQLLATPFWEEISTTDGTASVLDVPVQSTMAQIVIVANCPQNTFSAITSYSDAQARLAELADQEQGNLTMSSQVIVTETSLSAGDNYLGYTTMGENNVNGISEPVELTRLAARIDLVNVRTSFESDPVLKDLSVRLDEVSLRNMKTASRFFSADYWGAVMVDGQLATDGVTIPAAKAVINPGSPQTNLFRTYVMENQDTATPTELVIKATLVDETGRVIGEQKEFASTINLNGTTVQGVAHKLVKRNYVYRLNVNFTPASFEGTAALLDVQVEVVGWGPVNQNVDIE